MSGKTIARLEFVQTRAAEDDDCHFVCHCTGHNVSACGLDVSDRPFRPEDEPTCPLCELAWPDRAHSCPWGCSCDDECGPECAS